MVASSGIVAVGRLGLEGAGCRTNNYDILSTLEKIDFRDSNNRRLV